MKYTIESISNQNHEIHIFLTSIGYTANKDDSLVSELLDNYFLTKEKVEFIIKKEDKDSGILNVYARYYMEKINVPAIKAKHQSLKDYVEIEAKRARRFIRSVNRAQKNVTDDLYSRIRELEELIKGGKS